MILSKDGDRTWIGLDGRNLDLPQGTGIATYCKSLVDLILEQGYGVELLSQGSQRNRWYQLPETFLSASVGGVKIGDVVSVETGRRQRFMRNIFRLARLHFQLHRKMLRIGGCNRPQLMHWTSPLPLHFGGVPNIYTIHDLIPLTSPEFVEINRKGFLQLVRAIVAKADHILTVSETSRQAIINILDCPPEKITNTYLAVTIKPSTQDDSLVRLSSFGLKKNGYFFVIGAIEPRKNLPRLIQAHRISGCLTPLVIAGPPGPHAAAQLADLGPLVRRLDYLHRDDLVALLKHAKALLFPSLDEGFGLPLVEAMALGTPTLTSKGGATEEVAGGAAMLVDPKSGAALAQAISVLDSDVELRARLAGLGLKRAAHFSADVFKSRMQAIYDRVLPQSSR